MFIQSVKLVQMRMCGNKKHHIHPTLEGRMPIGSFGTPKTFRVPKTQLAMFA